MDVSAAISGCGDIGVIFIEPLSRAAERSPGAIICCICSEPMAMGMVAAIAEALAE